MNGFTKLLKFTKNKNPAVVALFAVAFLMLIAVIDYFLVGAKLQQCRGMSVPDIVVFYFSRTMAEYLMLGLGIVIGYKIAEDLKK